MKLQRGRRRRRELGPRPRKNLAQRKLALGQDNLEFALLGYAVLLAHKPSGAEREMERKLCLGPDIDRQHEQKLLFVTIVGQGAQWDSLRFGPEHFSHLHTWWRFPLKAGGFARISGILPVKVPIRNDFKMKSHEKRRARRHPPAFAQELSLHVRRFERLRAEKSAKENTADENAEKPHKGSSIAAKTQLLRHEKRGILRYVAKDLMKILFIGDIVAEAGRAVVKKYLKALREKHQIDIVIANGENMAGGFGITPPTYLEIMQAGVDIVTGGNHSFDKKESFDLHDKEDFLLRPANYPPELPGRGVCRYTSTKGLKLTVINLMGRVFMDPLDCPFRLFDKLYAEHKDFSPNIFVDFHAETTSEKMAFGWHVEGRASCVIGTHTHIATADERILPKGTAYLTDAGMTGPYDSVIGVDKDTVVERYVIRRGRKFEAATGNPWFCGAVVEIDAQTGKAKKIERLRLEASKDEV
jgi:metallophosphoesterase (TIGR00282 family)